jgi:hypothetical protein
MLFLLLLDFDLCFYVCCYAKFLYSLLLCTIVLCSVNYISSPSHFTLLLSIHLFRGTPSPVFSFSSAYTSSSCVYLFFILSSSLALAHCQFQFWNLIFDMFAEKCICNLNANWVDQTRLIRILHLTNTFCDISWFKPKKIHSHHFISTIESFLFCWP